MDLVLFWMIPVTAYNPTVYPGLIDLLAIAIVLRQFHIFISKQ